MVDEKTGEQLLMFFKALADPNRLKMVGLLSKEELSVEQISEILQISPSTVSHHLSKLSKAGLVSARAESYYNIYKLETGVLEDMLHQLLKEDTFPEVTQEINLDAYDQKVVKNYSFPDGRLKNIPVQEKKLIAILKYVVRDFEPNIRYSEKQVNEILEHYNEDYAQLRRELVEYGFMKREGGGGAYWLAEDKNQE